MQNMKKPIYISPTKYIYYHNNQIPQKCAQENTQKPNASYTDENKREFSEEKGAFFWNNQHSSIFHSNDQQPLKIKEPRQQSDKNASIKIKEIANIPNIVLDKKQQAFKQRQLTFNKPLRIEDVSSLRANIEKQRNQKTYWKNYALQLQEENKKLKSVQNSLHKNSDHEIQKLTQQKSSLEKQLGRLQSEKKNYQKKLHNYESRQKSLEKYDPQRIITFNNTQDFVKPHHHNYMRENEELKKIIANQQELLQFLNEELTVTKMKLLSHKYAKE